MKLRENTLIKCLPRSNKTIDSKFYRMNVHVQSCAFFKCVNTDNCDLQDPLSLCVDKEDNLYVCDRGFKENQIFKIN